VFDDIRIVEILRDGLPVAPGEDGDVVVTDLVNHAMPLIRYRIGDVASFLPGTCQCGREFSRLSAVKGRVSGTISTPDGRWVHGEFFTHLFYGVPGVRAFQVRQRSDFGVDVLVLPLSDFDPARIDPIVDAIRRHLGAGVRVDWQQVASIPLTPTGKHLFTVSEIPIGSAPNRSER
jgi:phenylacetate-CoA ligase